MADGLLNKASIILTPTGYKAGTLYNVAPIDEPYEDFDFARTSTATRINSSGLVSNVATGVPRISYDSNGENGHILLEPQSTNLYLNSEPTANEGIASNITYEPFAWDNGFTNCVRFADNSSTTYRYGGAALANTTYTLSCYVIMDDLSKPVVSYGSLFGDNTNNSNFDFSIIIGGIINPVLEEDIKYEDCGNNIWRVSRKGLVGASSLNNNGIIKYTGQSSKGFRAVGWQLEALSYATSYIPTLTGSTETRATETATGAGSADLINSTEGVLYAEIAALADDGTDRKISLNDGTNDNQIVVGFSRFSGNINAEIFYNGNLQSSGWGATSVTQNNFNKFALSWQNGNYKFFYNGVKTADQSISNTPSGLNQVKFSYGNNNQPMFCECKALAVFNEALSDDELHNLTG